MDTPKEKYFTEMRDYLNNFNELQGELLFSENLWDAVIRVTEE